MKIFLVYDPPPIPVRCFDYMAYPESYEPGMPYGRGSTEEDAIYDLLDYLDLDYCTPIEVTYD